MYDLDRTIKLTPNSSQSTDRAASRMDGALMHAHENFVVAIIHGVGIATPKYETEENMEQKCPCF